GDADFGAASFGGDADFGYANFSGDANFWDASFGDHAYFWSADFGGDAYFDGASFGDHAYFDGASFGDHAYFDGASFGGDAYFDATPPVGICASFGDHADFRGANFSGYAYFGGASFGDHADFRGANFSGYADFGAASFGGDAYFGGASFGGDAIFNSTEFNKVSFSNTTFTNVSLHGADFESMGVNWISLKDALVFDGPIYIKLIKNFREMEQFKDADDATYQYRRLSQANKEWSFSKLGDIFAWLSCGYGVRPWRTAAWAAATILIFTPFYFWRGGVKRLKENNEDEKQDVSLYDAFYFSMTTFTTLGYGDLYPADRYRMVAVMIEGLLGWLILALFLVTLANVMIRP
ncbi:MAG: pentapeptide repeat-containing protein, partial [Methanosarcinales archaeon]|nr:pentapeptide repeat-containing protein [Methanosarcinales archaeon]